MDPDHPTTSETAGQDGQRAEGIAQLPADMFDEVARRLPTPDPIETKNNLTNFKLVSRSVRQAIETPAHTAFERRLDELVRLARSSHELAIPHGDLSQFEYPVFPFGPGMASPSDRAEVVSPTLKFEGNARRSAFVGHILNLSPYQQAASLQSIANDLDDLDRVNRNRLLRRAVELFAQEVSAREVRYLAARALVRGHKHLEADLKLQLLNAVCDRFHLLRIYEKAKNAEHQAASLASRSPASPSYAEETHNSEQDSAIETISNKISDLANRTNTENLSARELVVDGLRPLGRSISNAYNSARAALIASDRSRARSNLAR